MSNTEADKRMQRFSVKHDRNKNEKNNAILFLVLEDRVFLKSVIYVNMLRVQNPKTRTGGVAQSTALQVRNRVETPVPSKKKKISKPKV
jgi:hypothetical protein